MNRFITLLLLLLTNPTSADTSIHQIDGKEFELASEFTIEKVAGLPIVQRPICADFDEQGRLYVAESSGTNDNVQIQLEQKPHRILRLEDTDNDGTFDQSRVFADKMMFPEGTLWYDGSLYVAAPPSIWKLTDTNDDGVADEREEWFQGKTLTGCANDLHGPYLGRDGWIYWCKGAFAEQSYDRNGKGPLVTRAAHIFRRRPGGGPIEPVMTGGMDNPVELIFTPGGERIFTTTFLQHPGGGKRDGIIHAIYGGVYGKLHNVIDGHPRTGELMPVLSHLGPAAPAGLLYLECNDLGHDYNDNLLTCCFNMRKIVRHELAKQGATFTTKDSDFLVCNDVDFHPTDLVRDIDGSLLVINTGGWYKLCCPTSQLHKPDILGAIYRVRRNDARFQAKRLDSSDLTVEDLVSRLGHLNSTINQQAIHLLSKRGKDVIPVLRQTLMNQKPSNVVQRLNSVWTLCRMDDPDARALIRSALDDPDETVRQAAIHAVSVWRDQNAVAQLISLLQSSQSSHNRRVAAEALGRIGDAQAVPAILNACHADNDRIANHSLIFALIEIADAKATRFGLDSENVETRRIAMISLSQMKDGNLTSNDVVPSLASSNAALREAANWVVARRNDWGQDLTDFFHKQLGRTDLTANEESTLVRQLANSSGDKVVQGFVAEILNNGSTQTRHLIFEAMRQAGMKPLPESWSQIVESILSNARHPDLGDALQTFTESGIPEGEEDKWRELLIGLSEKPHVDSRLRLQALAGLPKTSDVDKVIVDFLFDQLSSEDAFTKSQAIDAFTKLRLTTDQLTRYVSKLDQIGPLEIGHALDVLAQTNDSNIGEQVIAMIESSKSLQNVPSAILTDRLKHFDGSVTRQLEQLSLKFDKSLAEKREHMDRLVDRLKPGDIRRGHQVFHSKKAACSTCHQMAYLGGNIGPDLSHIGKIRTRRDLLEAIVYPNSSFVRSYEPHQIVSSSGKVFNGIVKEESSDGITLVTTDRKEIRLTKDDIEERLPGRVSVMPSGLDQSLSDIEMADLVAFLEAAK